MENLSYLMALCANLSFSSASMVYAKYSREVSPLWMNAFKSGVALAALTLMFIINPVHSFEPSSIGFFMISGFIGLCVGDFFLLKAFATLGPGRTLILFGFHPLILGTLSYILYGEVLSANKLFSILFFIGCLTSISLESYQKNRSWNLKGLGYALLGVLLDAGGILLTRQGFESAPEYGASQAHFFRTLGAGVGFFLWMQIKPIGFFRSYLDLGKKQKVVLIIASLAGTFLSLLLYLGAIKYGDLAIVTAIAITGPLFATLLELVSERQLPSRLHLVALGLFAIGFSLLVVF